MDMSDLAMLGLDPPVSAVHLIRSGELVVLIQEQIAHLTNAETRRVLSGVRTVIGHGESRHPLMPKLDDMGEKRTLEDVPVPVRTELIDGYGDIPIRNIRRPSFSIHASKVSLLLARV